MKKLLIVLAILFVTVVSAEAWTCKSSSLITSSTLLTSTGGTVCGVVNLADGTNASTVTVYDNNLASTSGASVLWKSVTAAGEYITGGLFPNMIRHGKGIYVTVSGTGSTAIIYYDAQ